MGSQSQKALTLDWLKGRASSTVQRLTASTPAALRWRQLLRRDRRTWAAARAAADGPRILLGPSLGRHRWEINFDAGLAIALTLRGARVELVTCDRAVPACTPWLFELLPEPKDPPSQPPQRSLCNGCYPPAAALFGALGLPLHKLSDYNSASDVSDARRTAAEVALQDIGGWSIEGVPVGEHAMAGAIRFFANADLSTEPDAEAVLRRYLEAAILSTSAMEAILSAAAFTALCCSHGIYVPHGPASEVARRRGVRVVNWHRAYRERSMIFSEGGTYHKTLLDEPTSSWDAMAWDDELGREIDDYLRDREFGKSDWISFNRAPEGVSRDALAALGIDSEKPIVGLLTNVAWDAQLHYGATGFSNMMEWLAETVGYFARRPDLQLLVRVHPAELKGHVRSRQSAVAAIRAAFPELPPNVIVVGPESSLSTYDAMALCNAVIIYATKTGIELTARGIPTIVAGEGWIKNKGFASDASTKSAYFELLDELPFDGRLPEALQTRARQYAYHFFFRRMIPLPFLDEHLLFQVKSIDELRPGAFRGLDVICDGIMTTGDFVYRSEVLSER